jgi:hypothetical protein
MAVLRLPFRVRAGMLAAVQRERIITGAYAKDDGICPLLGAHRYGNREGGAGFADAWDRFCGVRRGRPREATETERAVLIGLLEDSLFVDRGDTASRPPRPVPRRPVAVAGRA